MEDWKTLAALGSDGILWQTKDISDDGIYEISIIEDRVKCKVESYYDNSYIYLELDIKSGQELTRYPPKDKAALW